MTPHLNSFPPDNNSGSPGVGGPEFLVIGKLRRPHGLRGDILMSVLTDFPDRLIPGLELYAGDDYQPLKIKSVRWHRQDILIKFEGYEDRDLAGLLRNQAVSVRTENIPELEDGEYYQHELIGLNVFRADNDEYLGTVKRIIETGAANDVFLVTAEDGTELLLPDIESVVLDIDLERNLMHVNLMEGLLPTDKP